jgi:hypothetical protein
LIQRIRKACEECLDVLSTVAFLPREFEFLRHCAPRNPCQRNVLCTLYNTRLKIELDLTSRKEDLTGGSFHKMLSLKILSSYLIYLYIIFEKRITTCCHNTKKKKKVSQFYFPTWVVVCVITALPYRHGLTFFPDFVRSFLFLFCFAFQMNNFYLPFQGTQNRLFARRIKMKIQCIMKMEIGKTENVVVVMFIQTYTNDDLQRVMLCTDKRCLTIK